MKLPIPSGAARAVATVLGPVPHETLGITDAHNHVWISTVIDADAESPILDQYDLILAELNEYRAAGGGALLDCQPGGFGRDATKLQSLSQASGVHVLACTGFHRRKYSPGLSALWSGTPERIADLFVRELTSAIEDSPEAQPPVLAGFMKIALEGEWDQCPQNCVEAAGAAALQTHALLEIHTEKGALAERACTYFLNAGLSPRQVVLCHMDKRPDLGLHKALADIGVALEYDTFFRAKYEPSRNLWPLLERMAADGYADRVVLATDMAEGQLYRSLGGGPGLAGLPREIRDQLAQRGFSQLQQLQLLGGNIARRLAGMN